MTKGLVVVKRILAIRDTGKKLYYTCICDMFGKQRLINHRK